MTTHPNDEKPYSEEERYRANRFLRAECPQCGGTGGWEEGDDYIRCGPCESEYSINHYQAVSAICAALRTASQAEREMTIKDAIAGEVEIFGSLRQAAKQLGIDVGYLSRLESGEKDNPGDYVLEQLRLEKRVIYVRPIINYEPTPLIPRSKSA